MDVGHHVDLTGLHDENQIGLFAHRGGQLACRMACNDNAVFECGFNGLEIGILTCQCFYAGAADAVAG